MKDDPAAAGPSIELSPVDPTRKTPKLFGFRTMSQNAKQEKIRKERSRNRTRKDESMPIVISSIYMSGQRQAISVLTIFLLFINIINLLVFYRKWK